MKKHILVVEDSPAIAMDEEHILQQLGYEVYGPIGTGAKAVQFAKTKKLDAVLMDIDLPGDMNGVMAAQEIHKIDEIPVIFVTGFKQIEVPQYHALCTKTVYIEKPYTKTEIANALEMVLME